MSRIPLIVGNWKMYKTGREAFEYVRVLSSMIPEIQKRRVYLAVPFLAIEQAVEAAKGTDFVIGAQNMHDCVEGAFTGEVSARMIKSAGAKFVLLGHSERRTHFAEDNAFINHKLHRAFDEELAPILCIGESLKEREQNVTQSVLSKQLKECLKGLDEHKIAKTIIAYEPVWAIGTGKTATPPIAQETHRSIRLLIEQSHGLKSS